VRESAPPLLVVPTSERAGPADPVDIPAWDDAAPSSEQLATGPFDMLPRPERDEVEHRVGRLVGSLEGALDEGTGASLDILIESWVGRWVSAIESDYLRHVREIRDHRAQARQMLTQSVVNAEQEREKLDQISADYAAFQSGKHTRRYFASRRLRWQYREQVQRTAKAEAVLSQAQAALEHSDRELEREDQRRMAAIADRRALGAEAANFARVLIAGVMEDPAKNALTETGPVPGPMPAAGSKVYGAGRKEPDADPGERSGTGGTPPPQG
jgi:hypothetical protein